MIHFSQTLSVCGQRYLPRIDLIVLSACNTANGRITNYEGVLGLKRAIALSGVKSAILSMWQIEDNFTKDFMYFFYSRLAESNDVAEAFFNTQKFFRKKYPYDLKKWGGFILLFN